MASNNRYLFLTCSGLGAVTIINQVITPLFQILPRIFITFQKLVLSLCPGLKGPASSGSKPTFLASSRACFQFTHHRQSHRPCPQWGLCFISSVWNLFSSQPSPQCLFFFLSFKSQLKCYILREFSVDESIKYLSSSDVLFNIIGYIAVKTFHSIHVVSLCIYY